MTASKDSTLFGNDDDRTPAQRHDNEHESFASLPPGSAEPLFPAAPTGVTHSWADSLAGSNGSSVSNGTYAGRDWADMPQEAEISNATYDWQTGVYPAEQNDARDGLYGNGLYGDGPYRSADHDTYNNTYPIADASTGAETGARNIDATAQDSTVESARGGHEATQGSNHLDGLYAIPAPAEPVVERPVPAVVPPTVAQPAPKPILSERELLFNRHYAVLMDLMQHGAWPQALEKIQAMRTEFPEASLDALLDEATLKTELMARWATKIKGRRLTVGQEWLIRRSLPFFLLLLLFVSGAVFYQTFVAPSRQVVAMERANQALVDEATNLLQVGQIDQAINLYNLVLARNPEYAPAKQGLIKANSLFGLAVTYDVAIRVANSGNLQRSLLMLQSIKEQSPAFRDIDARIVRVESLLAAEKEYRLAERAFAQHRWLDAVNHYQKTKSLAEDYQAAHVLLQLSQSYFMGAQWLMSHWPTPQFGAEQIREFLRQAQQVNGQDEAISAFLSDLERFMKGERSLQNNNLRQAVETWGKLYEQQPAFLGGYLAEQLYRAYLALAGDVRTADPDYARVLYTLAAEMPVHDSSEARLQLQKLGTVAPAAQPTPTPRPTIAYVAPAVVAPPPATPTPEPTATPANSYQGWIAFRTTRAGFEEIYVMRGDGSEQQLATEEVRSRIDSLYQEERRGPDGRMAFVQSANGRSDANIYVAGSDGMSPSMLTDYNGDEYDPVWSPAGDRIVFVSNHTGNDEIWMMRADGGEQRQLTFNNWEWDKHPTWSPDSSQIAFFSNRSGKRQVWVMGTDGSAQRNLSNNNYDDWDPVWIK